MLSRIMTFISQDVKNENETKKVAVILRVNSLLMSLYFISLAIIFGINGSGRYALQSILSAIIFILPFYLTYINYTKWATVASQIIYFGCILLYVWEFGWDSGIQYFIFTLLILIFTTSHIAMKYRIVISVGLGIIHLGLYFHIGVFEIESYLTGLSFLSLRIVNAFFLFTTMAAALYYVSKDSIDMELKLMQYNVKMHRLASIDPLTGLMNRRSINEYLENLEKNYKDGIGANISIALGDIDFFKNVNDTYGHDCGDAVLKFLADLFNDYMFDKGQVGRWGGEEFIFIFYDCNGDEAFILMDELLSLIRKSEINYGEHTLKMTVTFGLEDINFRKGMEAGIDEADKKMYLGKKQGRNRIIY